MAYCLDSYELIICPECQAKVAYEDRDVQVLTATSCDFLSLENKTHVARVIRCPKCYRTVEIEKLSPFIMGVDLKKKKDQEIQ